MKYYLLSVITPEGAPVPPPEVLDPIMERVEAINRDLRAAGSWVFAGGLNAPSTATMLRLQDGEIITTDGPFAEGKEYVGGFSIIRVPDLDAALEWGRKLTQAITLPIEVRPFAGVSED